MRSEFEKEALKEVILSNKKDIIKNIENSLNSNPTKKEKIDLENLLIRLEGASIPCIFSNLDNDIIDSYVVDMIEGKVYRCRLYDFYFEYDNQNHKLFVSSFVWDAEEDEIV